MINKLLSLCLLTGATASLTDGFWLPQQHTVAVAKIHSDRKYKYVDIYGHRGLRGLYPENTIPGYQAALKVGVDAVDMDINMTKDNVLVVTHDLTLNPSITKDRFGHWITKKVPIKNLTFKQLETYTVGEVKPGSAYSRFFPHRINMNNVHIPSLVQVIHYVRARSQKVRFQIEIKTDPHQPNLSQSPLKMAQVLYHVLKSTGITYQAEIQAFEWKALISLHKIDPLVQTNYLTLAPFVTDKKWTAPLDPADYNWDFPKMIKVLDGNIWGAWDAALLQHQSDLKEAHRLGLKVVVWSIVKLEGEFPYSTVNQMLKLQVDGIVTDRPDILKRLEDSKPPVPTPVIDVLKKMDQNNPLIVQYLTDQDTSRSLVQTRLRSALQKQNKVFTGKVVSKITFQGTLTAGGTAPIVVIYNKKIIPIYVKEKKQEHVFKVLSRYTYKHPLFLGYEHASAMTDRWVKDRMVKSIESKYITTKVVNKITLLNLEGIDSDVRYLLKIKYQGQRGSFWVLVTWL